MLHRVARTQGPAPFLIPDLFRREHEGLVAEGMICPYVFHRSGRPIKGFVKAWKSACQTAGCPGKLPHDFRRTAIRNLVRSGVPEKTAMAITGHKSVRSGRVVELPQSPQVAENKG